MLKTQEIELCTLESEFHLRKGPFESVEEFSRSVALGLKLIELIPKVVRARQELFTVSRGESLGFSNEAAEEFFKVLAAKPFRLMFAYQGAQFHPVLQLCLEACERSPRASTMMFNEAMAGEGASSHHTAFDMVNALNELVEHLAMAFKSHVFKDSLRKWNARCKKSAKRVEIYIDGLAKKEPFIDISSLCLVEPAAVQFGDLANHVRTRHEELVASMRARLGRSVRGAVVSVRIVPEGIRYDTLLVGRGVSNPETQSNVRGIWWDLTEGGGHCYCLDRDGSTFAYRSMSASSHLPASEQRRRAGLYFGMSSWLIHWDQLGTDDLKIVEFDMPAVGWPFPAKLGAGFSKRPSLF